MQFIAYRPNVVLVGADGEVDVIREAEDLERHRAPRETAAATGT